LSGYALEKLGWVKKGFVWVNGYDTIEYDGCWWTYCPIPECLEYTIEAGVIHKAIRIEFVDQLIR
jgi:hypothetical protein